MRAEESLNAEGVTEPRDYFRQWGALAAVHAVAEGHCFSTFMKSSKLAESTVASSQ